MRQHNIGDDSVKPLDMGVITRAMAGMGVESRRRMMAIRDLTKPKRRKPGRTTVGRSTKAAKILRGQR